MKDFLVDFGPPRHGWLAMRLRHAGQELEVDGSYLLNDSIDDLLVSLHALVDGGHPRDVRWFLEPDEMVLSFAVEGDRTTLRVRDHVERMRVDGDTRELARAFWRGLSALVRQVSPEEYERAWRHPLPVAAIELLGQKLEQKLGR